jgi:DNA modification methylase
VGDPGAWRNRIVGSGEEAPDQLVANPLNWRVHPGAQRDALRGSLATVGWVQQVLVNRRTGHVVDGHARVEEALSREEPMVPVLYVDLEPEEEAIVLATLDPISAMATTDDAKLRELLEGVTVDDAGLAAMLGNLVPTEPKAGLMDPDDVPPLGEETHIKRGDLFALGDHRLMCGDATSIEDAARLLGGVSVDVILTDPPYGIALDTDYSKMPGGNAKSIMHRTPNTYRPIVGDAQPFDAAPIRESFGNVAEQFWFGADYYRRSLGGSDLDGSWLVWDKRSPDSDTVIGSGFELIWSAQRHKRDLLRHYWNGAIGSAEARGRVHPTQKPSALMAEILDRWSEAGAVVWDGFSGSGTTIIAAEQLGRRCYAMEIDPRYVAVTIERWEKFTGRTSERIDG